MIKFGILGNPSNSKDSKIVTLSGNDFGKSFEIKPAGVFGKDKWENYHLKEIELCKNWLKFNALPRKTMNKNQSSYGLKHVVEDEVGEYISNGAFIRAAVEFGYTGYWDKGLNCNFNMTFGVIFKEQNIIK